MTLSPKNVKKKTPEKWSSNKFSWIYLPRMQSWQNEDFSLVHPLKNVIIHGSDCWNPGWGGGVPSLKLTANAPENGWLEYFLVSFWGKRPIFRCELAVSFPPQQWCRHSAAPWFRDLEVFQKKRVPCWKQFGKHRPPTFGEDLEANNKFYYKKLGNFVWSISTSLFQVIQL